MSDPHRPRYSYDERLTEVQREQWDEAQHALQQSGRGGTRPAMEGAAGGFGLVLLFAGVLLFMLYGCFFPTVALVTIAVGYLVSTLFDLFVPGVGWIAHFLVLLSPAYLAFMMMREVEATLERSPAYRAARHVLRLLVTGYLAHVGGILVLEFDRLQRGLPINESFTVPHVTIIVVALAIVHVVGRWYDRQLVSALQAAAHGGEAASARPSAGHTPTGDRSAQPRRRLRIPGIDRAPAALQRGLATLTMAGAAFGAFLGYAGFETFASTTVGLLAGSVGGAMLMCACWLVTRPVGALFERLPVLWPLLIGTIIGVGIAWRLACVDQVAIASYLVPGVLGGVMALTVPYLGYALLRRCFARSA